MVAQIKNMQEENYDIDEVTDGKFLVPLSIYFSPKNKREEFGGLINLTSIASLFIDYLPNWEVRLRECMELASEDSVLNSDNEYLLGSCGRGINNPREEQ